jgi:tetratricopeptide (TPR) repeat protein
MKTQTSNNTDRFKTFLVAMAVCLAVSGCERRREQPASSSSSQNAESASVPDPLAWLLAPHDGASRLDEKIRKCQEQLREGKNQEVVLERLGWLFVAKARESFDAGFYKLAEQCALALELRQPGSHEAMLLRGHALQNQHRFREAEPLARELVASRGLPFDYGLLGDVLMEQGQLAEAAEACQKMIDLRPDLHSYARGAHLRWLKGDLIGAMEMMQAAVDASSPHDPDAAAWTRTRLAALHFQAGATADAERTCDEAVALRPDYPPALLMRGRMLLAGDDRSAAVDVLERAVRANPLPEYQWTFAEALRAAGREQEAAGVEARLRSNGAAGDPRTLSLYLATRGEEPQLAVRLSEEEFQQRQDVFTRDALAWALAAAGRLDEARTHMSRALAEGTDDARLWLHATVIAARAGQHEEAAQWLEKAGALAPLLLPSEVEQLETAAELIANPELARLPESFPATDAESPAAEN